jgi:hypothetical protein
MVRRPISNLPLQDKSRFCNGYLSEELANTRFEPELDCRADRLDFFS